MKINNIFEELVAKFDKEVHDFQNELKQNFYNVYWLIDEYFENLLNLIKKDIE